LHKLGEEMVHFWLKVLMTKFRLRSQAAISAAHHLPHRPGAALI